MSKMSRRRSDCLDPPVPSPLTEAPVRLPVTAANRGKTSDCAAPAVWTQPVASAVSEEEGRRRGGRTKRDGGGGEEDADLRGGEWESVVSLCYLADRWEITLDLAPKFFWA